LPEKVTKFLNSIYDICPKMPEFYIRPMFDRKIIFRDFFCGGGGQDNTPIPSPTPMAGIGWAPGPPPAKFSPAGASIRSFTGSKIVTPVNRPTIT